MITGYSCALAPISSNVVPAYDEHYRANESHVPLEYKTICDLDPDYANGGGCKPRRGCDAYADNVMLERFTPDDDDELVYNPNGPNYWNDVDGDNWRWRNRRSDYRRDYGRPTVIVRPSPARSTDMSTPIIIVGVAILAAVLLMKR